MKYSKLEAHISGIPVSANICSICTRVLPLVPRCQWFFPRCGRQKPRRRVAGIQGTSVSVYLWFFVNKLRETGNNHYFRPDSQHFGACSLDLA